MCINVIKGKEEVSFAFSCDGGEICCCSGVVLEEQRGSALKSGPSCGGNPAAQIYKPLSLADVFFSGVGCPGERDHFSGD